MEEMCCGSFQLHTLGLSNFTLWTVCAKLFNLSIYTVCVRSYHSFQNNSTQDPQYTHYSFVSRVWRRLNRWQLSINPEIILLITVTRMVHAKWGKTAVEGIKGGRSSLDPLPLPSLPQLLIALGNDDTETRNTSNNTRRKKITWHTVMHIILHYIVQKNRCWSIRVNLQGDQY